MFRVWKGDGTLVWQALVWELVIVTIGVLIALGAQHWAESRSLTAKADTARKALRSELADHHLYAVEWRIVAPCINAQLDALEQRVLASGSKLDPAPAFPDKRDVVTVSYALRAPSRPYDDSVWQATNAEGVSSFLHPEERLELGRHYKQAADVDDENKQITELASGLSVLTIPLDLDPGVRMALLQQLAAIRGHNRWMIARAGQLVGHIHELHMDAPREEINALLDTSGTVRFCRAQHLPMLPLAKALVPEPEDTRMARSPQIAPRT